MFSSDTFRLLTSPVCLLKDSNNIMPSDQNRFLLDTLCYYLHCGSQPVNLPLYSVKVQCKRWSNRGFLYYARYITIENTHGMFIYCVATLFFDTGCVQCVTCGTTENFRQIKISLSQSFFFSLRLFRLLVSQSALVIQPLQAAGNSKQV